MLVLLYQRVIKTGVHLIRTVERLHVKIAVCLISGVLYVGITACNHPCWADVDGSFNCGLLVLGNKASNEWIF